MVDLSIVELSVYILIWTGSVFYSMYKCHIASDIPGWKWVGRRADTADFEWKMWTPIFISWLKYVALYLLISLVIKKKNPQSMSMISTAMSFLWVWSMLGPYLTIFVFIQPVIFHWILKLFSLAIVWLTCLIFTLALHAFHLTDTIGNLFEEDSHQEYFFSVLLAWTHARSISFLVDTRSTEDSKNMWPNCYYYCFYLPLLPSGPLMLYRDFRLSIEKPSGPKRTISHIRESSIQIARYLFWWFFHQFALHFFYHSALQYNIGIVRRLDVWTAAGLGYSLGQFFMTKYLVLYGLPTALAKLDRVDSPPPPKCVGRIHLYSQMWRDFDRGLYNFMLNYIYIPCKGTSDRVWAKLAGTALCFSFVCIWHGASNAVFIWCVSNYFGICLETAAKYLSTQKPIANWKANWSSANWIRFQAAISSPLLLMSALSNFCFFTDANVGFVLARKAIYDGGIVRLLFILFVLHCCCHVSMALGRRKSKAKLGSQHETFHQE
uniref:EOG090X06SF n=1 Tax=Megafenestra aurita TaxID=2291010 RepID=A0A4Y7NII8_9CRUS|nr:EOG090X06SF [Megafenestra aurita]